MCFGLLQKVKVTMRPGFPMPAMTRDHGDDGDSSKLIPGKASKYDRL
jgi:hypothetical protein